MSTSKEQLICSNQKDKFYEFLDSLDKDFVKTLSVAVDRSSILILDSINISSSKVRNRTEELLETTLYLTRKQAFFQATIEEVENNANT